MTKDIPEALLGEFSQFVATHIGLHFPNGRWTDLQRGLQEATSEFGFEDGRKCIEWLMAEPLTQHQIEILASYLTVGETYFFRDKRSFEILGSEILPELIRSRRDKEQRLRIWSAGCCTGEEAYSIAIMLRKILPDRRDWSITILASDINPRFLKKASEGVFGKWSFRECSDEFQKGYFQKTGDGRFEIAPDIKKMVSFTYLNLVEDVFPSLTNNTNTMDVILCRNVLMYFSPDQAKKVSANLYRSLVGGGWLFTSPSETSQILFSDFVPASFPGAILYKKTIPVEARKVSEAWVPRSIPAPNRPEIPVADFGQAGVPVLTEFTTPALEEKDANAMSAQARACANEGRLTEALAWCDKAIATDKLNPSAYYLYGVILQEQGAVDKAAAALRRALYLDHDFALAHFALGNLSWRQAKYREASRCFENALHLLRRYRADDVLPESEGITAGRLSVIIQSMKEETP